MKNDTQFGNKKVSVVGLGESGFDAALLLKKKGAIVSVTDANDTAEIRKNAEKLRKLRVNVESGFHTEGFLKGSSLIVLSPGIPDNALPVRFALKNKIPLISELELGYRFCPCPIIAVTGTNGKSTVVTLMADILKKSGKDALLCGNIGNSISGEVEKMGPSSICVLEVSSYQLERIIDFRPYISCILNVAEDHLDRYSGFRAYTEAKFRIFSRQTKEDALIINYDCLPLRKAPPSECRRFFYSKTEKVKGVYADRKKIMINLDGKPKKLLDMPETALKGAHNLENIIACALMSALAGVKAEVIKRALEEFKALAHRTETVAEINGVDFIDDSKATNIDAAKRALESIEGKVILIAGGRDKGGDYSVIRELIRAKVRKMILIGEAAPVIKKAFDGFVDIIRAGSLEEAVALAYKGAKIGDAVLLSPMCSSFDMFRDYKHRGEVFSRAVKKLKLKLCENLAEASPKAGKGGLKR